MLRVPCCVKRDPEGVFTGKMSKRVGRKWAVCRVGLAAFCTILRRFAALFAFLRVFWKYFFSDYPQSVRVAAMAQV